MQNLNMFQVVVEVYPGPACPPPHTHSHHPHTPEVVVH